jgi:hypothetical protein
MQPPLKLSNISLVQWKQLNVITLGESKIHNINQISTLTTINLTFCIGGCKNTKPALEILKILIILTKR